MKVLCPQCGFDFTAALKGVSGARFVACSVCGYIDPEFKAKFEEFKAEVERRLAPPKPQEPN